MSDFDNLLEMGFSKIIASKAIRASKEHQDDEDINVEVEEKVGEEEEFNEAEKTAQSLVCQDCSKLLRNAAAAEFHAVKTGHQNFAESLEAIKPLSEEEKKAKLEEIRVKMAAKKEEKRLKEIEEEKAREKVRRVTGKEMVELKEKQKELEMQKALLAKKKEKEEDRAAKQKIREQIEADKRDRAARAEKEKLDRQGIPTPVSNSSNSSLNSNSLAPKVYTDARIQIRLPSGLNLVQVFKIEETVSAIYDYVEAQTNVSGFKLYTTFPRKVLEDKQATLKSMGLAPSSALVMIV